MINLEDLLKEVIFWAKEAGKFQLKNFRRSDLIIDSKSNITDLVTEVDKGSEDIILGRIRERFPKHSILSEESGEDMCSSDYVWIVDPLDGTNNYAQGVPIFCISIALRYKGEGVLGVVYAPYLDELFTGVKRLGATLNNKKINVGRKSELDKCILATGFPYDKRTNPINNIDYFSKITPNLRGIRRMGAAAYDLSLVAAGLLDGFWEMNLSLWDVAAGIIIIREAGGSVIDFRCDRNVSIVAGNNNICKNILLYLK